MKKIISVLLTITMLLGVISSMPLSASAATTDNVESGAAYTDDYGTWIYELTDDGNGYKITDYTKGSATDIQIPATINGVPVLEIGNYAFGNCSSLTSITISDSVTTIGTSAFSSCSSLTSIDVLSNNQNYSSIDGVLFNKTRTMLIKYPKGKELDDYTIPDSVTTIGESAFEDCKSLTSITIPNSVTTIGESAFSSCDNLTTITIPNSITTIGHYTFGYCSRLTSITIPNSVTAIGRYAFRYCDELTDVYYTGSEDEWNNISIDSTNNELKKATIHYNYVISVAGDISGDGILAVNDVIFVLKNIVGNQELTAEQLALADVSDDGKLTILDAILLQKLVLEMV